MEMMMIARGDYRGLRIDPENEEGRALLASFGIRGGRPGQAADGRAVAEPPAEGRVAIRDETPEVLAWRS